MRKPSLCIVGPGRLGSALAVALHAVGYLITEIVTRDSPDSFRKARAIARQVNACAAVIRDAAFDCDVVWLCVPDAQIASVAALLADHCFHAKKKATNGSQLNGWQKKTVFHASGALTSERLAPLVKVRASVASVHPMMTFVGGSHPNLAGVSFAVEGDAKAKAIARGIVRGLKGALISIATEDKPLYHAWGAFASPLMICLLATADRIAAELGLSEVQARQTLEPILRQTIENYIARGPAEAFSGPLVRGDVETVRAHLAELGRVDGAKDVYLALAKGGIESLPVANREEIERVLKTGPGAQNSIGVAKRPLKIGGIIQPY